MMSQPIRDVFVRWTCRLRSRRYRTIRRPSIITVTPRVTPMEERLAPAALIAPQPTSLTVIPGATSGSTISAPAAANQQADFGNPVVAANPVNSAQQVLVTQSRRIGDGLLGLQARFTTDSGQTWTTIPDFGASLVDHTGATATTRFNNSSQPTITFGRDGIFYIAYVTHTTDRSAGAVVVESFVFNPFAPLIRNVGASLPNAGLFVNGGTATQNVVYRWSNGRESAQNPVIAVDNNIATFTDPDTGATLRDTLVDIATGRPKAVYLAWNVVGVAPTAPDRSFVSFTENRFNVNAIFASVSTDAGINFSAPAPVNGNSLPITSNGILLAPNAGYFAENDAKSATASPGGSQPVIAFSPGSSSGPGRVVIGWVGSSTTPNQSKTYFDVTRPDDGNAAQAVAQIKTYGVSFFEGAQPIDEATKNDGPPTPAFDGAKTTNSTFTVSAADIANWSATDRITNLTTTISISHPRVQQLSAVLVSPGGTRVTLFNNRVLGDGSDRKAPAQPTITAPFGAGLGLSASATNGANRPWNGLGRSKDNVYGVTFDDYAPRRITDPANSYPFIGSYKAESWADSFSPTTPSYTGKGALSAFVGFTKAQVQGTWTLEITDFRNDRITDGAQIQPQFVSYFGVNITSAQTQQGVVPGFGTEQLLTNADGKNVLPVSGGAGIDPFANPITDAASSGTPGIAPGLSIAFDTSIQPFNDGSTLFTRPSGQLYIAYTKDFFQKAGGAGADYDIFFSRATLAGINNTLTFADSFQLNDDALADGFSEGNRQQFLPTVAVDPATGTVGVMWYDARTDASKTRVATYFATSSDGGETFSPSPDGGQTVSKQITLNLPRTATNLIEFAATAGNVARSTYTFEPIPTNVSLIPGGLGLGLRQGLIAVAPGKFNAYWTGNLNDANTKTSLIPSDPEMAAPGGNIFRSEITGAAGPRIVEGSMGAIAGTTLQDFLITFDRPIDINSFTPADVRLQFRSANSPLSALPVNIPIASITPLNAGGVLVGFPGVPRAASVFRVNLATPQTAVGTYSYFISSAVNDLVRTFSFGGNLSDQNNDGIAGSDGTISAALTDVFAVPGPDTELGNTTPGIFPFNSLTSPLIITGPRFVSAAIPGQPFTTDNLVLNTSASKIDVTFDRAIKASTFEADGRDILRITGPVGVIFDKNEWDTNRPGTPYPVSVSKLSAVTFRVTFPVQVLSGAYSIEFGPNIEDTLGNKLDNNQNAGLAILRGGGDPTTGSIQVNTYNNDPGTVSILPGQTVSQPLTIADLFTIEQTLTQRIQLRINITHPNVPDLEADLIAPDGTVLRLFSGVGTAGTIRANFTNTLFDDGGLTTIQSGLAPFNTGPYTPQFPLSALRGRPTRVLDVNGNPVPWQLRIRNNGSQAGTIQNFSLTLPNVLPGTGLGEAVSDRFSAGFRIFTQDATNPLTKQVFTPIGPAPTNAQDNVSRITGLAADPSDPSGNTVFAGGASGGIFKTTNFLTQNPSGPNWIPLTDFGPTWNLNTGSIAVFPRNNDPNQSIVFVLTGEGDTGTPGVGVLRSLDGGRTWVVLSGLNNVDNTGKILPIDSNSRTHEFVGSTGFKIVVDPTATPSGDVIAYIAVSGSNGGVYRTTNTGRTWQLIRAGNATSIHLSQGSRSTSSFSSGSLEFLFASFRGEGVFTTPQATSATSMSPTNGTPGVPLIRDTAFTPDQTVPVNAPAGTPNGAKGRISLSGPASTGDVLQDTFYAGWLYAIVSSPIGTTDGLYLTKDFGVNWVKVRFPVFIPNPAMKSIGFPTNNETRNDQELFAPPALPNGQGNYNQDIVVDPSDPEIVYVAGLGNGNGVPLPAGGLIRVDVSGVSDTQNFSNFDNSSATSAIQSKTTGALTNKGSVVGFGGNVTNLSRDPNNPFNANSSVKVASASKDNRVVFTNTGENATWSGFIDLLNTGDLHRLIAIRDQLSGKTRLIGSGDHQVFTGVDDGSGVLLRNIGFNASVNGTRNGNLQLLQGYAGAVQPSQLATDIAQAFVYANAQDNGFPVSGPNVLTQGNIEWTGPRGDGSGVAVDQTGSGTAYQYRWPCCQGGPGLATDFFRVINPPGPGGSAGASRTNGLIQPGDDPATDTGQWPQIADVGYFTVNPIDGNGIVVSSNAGRIFRTTNQGKNWFPIAEPVITNNTYARALAFGAPNPATPGELNNYIYVGTNAGRVLVTTNGGGSWTDISNGIAGSGRIMQIVTNPQRGTRSAYAVTDGGVFFLADSNIGTWVEISGVGTNPSSGNIFNLRDPIFGDANNALTNPVPNNTLPFSVKNLFTIQADYRYAIPFDVNDASKGTFPILYVGGQGGVFRSLNNGTTWEAFPGSRALVDPATGNPILDPITGQQVFTGNGGGLPNSEVRDLDLALGNIDPLTGFPRQASGGFNMLVATTYGRGSWAIRLEDPAAVSKFQVVFQSGPRVAGLAADTKGSFFIRFEGAVDPNSFTAADIKLTDAKGNPITVSSVSPASNLVGGVDQRNLFRVVFANTSNAETYNVVVGPAVFDFAGFGMNQNRDKTNGDTTTSPVTGAAIDAYAGTFRTVNAVAQTGNLFIDAPFSTRAGVPSTVTVSAVGVDGKAITNYAGTISFTSTDSKIFVGNGLPNNYQFGPLDQGTRSFPVFYRTATFNPALPPIRTIVTDTSAVNPLGSATGKTEVRGGDASKFAVSGIASPTGAGVPRNVVVSALDSFGNIADTFTGKVSFTSSDPLVSSSDGLPTSFTFVASNFGKATVPGQVALRTAGFQFVRVTDDLSGLVIGQQSNIEVLPDTAKTLVVSKHSNFLVAGTRSDFTVVAKDKFNNIATGYTGTIRFTSSDSRVSAGNGLPANFTFTATDKGTKDFDLGTRLKTAGVQSITATDTTTGSITGKQSNIQVVAAPASQFTVSGHPATTIAGKQNSFTVFAADEFGNRAAGYTGSVAFSSTDPLVGSGNGLPNPYTFTASDAGQKVFTNQAVLKTVGSQSIIVTDATNDFTGRQTGITVTAAAGTSLRLTSYPSPTTAGVGNTFTVTARDPFGNLATSYLGTVRFSSTDPLVSVGNGLPQNYTFRGTDNGTKNFSATELRTAGLQTLTVSDTAGGAAGSQSGILVLPAAVSRLSVAGYPSSTTAGVANTLTVTARDRFNNLATNYQGTVFFSSTDGLVSANKGLPSNATFQPSDNGKRTFAATLKTAGTQSITATDIVNPNVTATQSGILVTAGTLSRLTVGGFPSPVVAGLSTGLTIAAADAFGNPVSNFTGKVNFSSSDTTADILDSYTFTAADTGRKSFSAGFALRRAGTQSITATVAGNANLTGTQSDIEVIAAPATKFVVDGFPDPVEAAVAAQFRVTARDQFNNLANSYDGETTVTSTDPRAIITNPVTLTNGRGTGNIIFRTAGAQTVTVTDASDNGLSGTSAALAVAQAPPGTVDPVVPDPLSLATLTAVGTDAGVSAQVTVLNPDGSVRNVLTPFDPAFTGGARPTILRTPITGDPLVAVASGAGIRNVIQVINLKSGLTVASYQPFEDAFDGGVFVTSGDLNNDGFDDIVASPDFGGGPRVVIFDGKTGNRLADFFGIDDSSFRGGARATLTDINGDKQNDLVVAAGIGGGPRIAIYDGKTVNIATQRPTPFVNDFFAFEPELRNGAYVAGGDFNNDGFGDIAFSAGPGGGPRVRVINGDLLIRALPFNNLDELDPQVQFANFFAGDVENRGGIRISAKDLDNDGRADLVTAGGPSSTSVTTSFTGTQILTRVTPSSLWSYEQSLGFDGGIFVG